MESTSVYWVACPSVCRHAVPLKSVTDVDKSFVASSLPFDGTGRHIIRQVLIVAAHNGTSVRLASPQSAADEAGSRSTPGSQRVHLDEFQTVTVQSRVSDLTGLSIEATKPIFVSISLSSKLRRSFSVTANETDSTPSDSNGSVQNEQRSIAIYPSSKLIKEIVINFHRHAHPLRPLVNSPSELNSSVQNEQILYRTLYGS